MRKNVKEIPITKIKVRKKKQKLICNLQDSERDGPLEPMSLSPERCHSFAT